MLSEFERNVVQSFWDWIEEHKDYVGIQYYDENHDEDRFWLYVGFDHDTLNAFTDRYQYQCEEGGCECFMQMNGICFDVKNLEGGYGFTMKELWDNRPKGIEDRVGSCVY